MVYTKEQSREYARKYRQKHPEYVLKGREWNREYAKKKYHKEHPDAPYRNSTGKYGKDSVCAIIKQHHEAMKEDPEHLTTEFIKKLIKVDCKDV